MAYIFRKDNSRFWWVGYKDGGRSIRKSLKVSAKDAARILLAEYQTLEAREANNSTLLTIKRGTSEAVNEYVEGDIGKSHETVREKKGSLRRFVKYLDDRTPRLGDITACMIEDYYRERFKQTLAGANKDLKVVKTFLNHAVRKGYLRINPALGVKKVKPVKKIFRSLSCEDAALLLETARKMYPHLYPICAALYYLGLRKREAIFLEWGDVNMERNLIYVRSKPENRVKDCEERVIPMSQKLRLILDGASRRGSFVFPTPSGVPWKNNLLREFRKVVMAAGLKSVSLQTMRETFGSHLLQRGVSIYLVSKYLGHSSVDVTTRHYAHIPIEETHKEIDLL